MATRTCWHCNTLATMEPQSSGSYAWDEMDAWHDAEMAATLYQCPGCSYPSVQLVTRPARDREGREEWLPATSRGKEFPDVPTEIASAADEAHRCRSIDALRGAIILARAVIEATCKEKSAAGRTLRDRIDALYAMKLVNELVKDEAHEIRHLGNDMAHGDFGDTVTEKDADDTLDLMAEVLEEVYQRPARVAARRLARQQTRTS